MQGHFDKGRVEAKKYLQEVRIGADEKFKLGQQITVEALTDAKAVHVTGVSKGKGFAGVMKRHNFKGGPGGHGSHFHRAPGSVGQCATPSRVFKGLKLPGHMGAETITVRNLEIVKIDLEQNLLIVKGAVPGGKGALLTIRVA
jgi:large subunit ribosomal protein L3